MFYTDFNGSLCLKVESRAFADNLQLQFVRRAIAKKGNVPKIPAPVFLSPFNAAVLRNTYVAVKATRTTCH